MKSSLPRASGSASRLKKVRSPSRKIPEGDAQNHRHWLIEYFGIDLRGLAFIRMVAGALVLTKLLIHYPDIHAFYTDDGVMPRNMRLGTLASGVPVLSLFWVSGSLWWAYLHFWIHGLLAVILIAGYKTRLVSVAVWLMSISLISGNSSVANSGDLLFGCLLLWGVFVPWGARCSVDSMRFPGVLPKRVLSVGTAALVLQMPLLYFFSGIIKRNDASWTVEFTAVANALLSHFASPIGTHLLELLTIRITQLMTAGTLFLEVVGPFVLFYPLFPRLQPRFEANLLARTRIVMVGLFATMHVGLAITLDLVFFQLVSFLGLLPLLPSAFWDSLGRKRRVVRLKGALCDRVRAILAPLSGASRERRRTDVGRTESPQALTVTCWVLFLYVIGSNLQSVGLMRMPRMVEEAAWSIRLSQDWRMFGYPIPRTGYFVMPGLLRDGREIDLFAQGGPIAGTIDLGVRAELKTVGAYAETYSNARWLSYFRQIPRDRYGTHAEYVARMWNRYHEGDDQLLGFDIFYVSVPIDPVQRRLVLERAIPTRLWRHWCFREEDLQSFDPEGKYFSWEPVASSED
jgi:hypothetical protein